MDGDWPTLNGKSFNGEEEYDVEGMQGLVDSDDDEDIPQTPSQEGSMKKPSEKDPGEMPWEEFMEDFRKSRPELNEFLQQYMMRHAGPNGSSADSSLTADDGRWAVKDEDAMEGARQSRNPSDAERREDEGEKVSSGISLFEVGQTAELNDIEQPDWMPLPKPLVVDSGAGETVIPRGWLVAHPVKDSPGSLAKDFYFTADGSKVYNEGQKELYMCTPNGGQIKKMTFQVAKVSKALGSVSKMVDHGHKVVFDTDWNGKDISYIENKQSKEKTWLRRENGVYVLDMLVAPPSFQPGNEGSSGFSRRGAP